MTLRLAVRVAICVMIGAVACRGPVPTARDRLLGELRGDAVTVVVADSRAISHSRIRAVLDVVAGQWPASMGCVLEAAYGGEQAALSIDRNRNVTVLVATTADPRCGALSQRAPGLWIATIGAGPAAAAPPVRDDARFARALPYLRTAPIAAVALGIGDAHAIATAQPEPFEAWLAIDAPGGDEIEQAVQTQIDKLRGDPSAAAFAGKLQTSRAGNQVVVRLASAPDLDLVAAARTVISWAEDRTRPDTARFTCPDPGPDTNCSNGTTYQLGRLREELMMIIDTGQVTPVVESGVVTGLRLGAPVPHLGLDAGDVVVAVDGRPISSRAMFQRLVPRARGETTVMVRRGTTEQVLHFVER
jgi:hypothetical protein